ncbi:dihydroneopterin aldolase [Mesobacillus zeae]|uniref:7,8-dihydroneopterin aldolase n=1 Tax=Mesobacillus zeae TaxID=1917180 RepID=A0A398BEA0_9BACI|nr:dihydroneopterin aldolase [Mesobacillus zeae]RID88555.1 dihydroneopterin aldolase [Mesobacillus zeae]
MDKIHVNGMQFYGYHGVFPEETKLGQRFAIDLTVETDLSEAGKSDSLEDSINYGELYEVCREVAEGPPFKLVEAVAEKIAAVILNRFPLAAVCHVKVIKPDPPIPGHYKSVQVEITRGRY